LIREKPKISIEPEKKTRTGEEKGRGAEPSGISRN